MTQYPLLKPGYVGKLKNGMPYCCYATDCGELFPIHGKCQTAAGDWLMICHTLSGDSDTPGFSIDLPPKMVPLEEKDVPPGSAFKMNAEHPGWVSPISIGAEEVWFCGRRGVRAEVDTRSYVDLQTDGWLIIRPGETVGVRCEKEETK